MKKGLIEITLGAALMFTGAVMARAGTIDDTLGAWWKDIAASKNFHLLDNASIEICKDLNRHAYYTGSSTYLYKYGYLSVDFIGIKRLESSSTVIPGAGVKFFIGDYLYDKVKPVRQAVDYLLPTNRLMVDSFTLGVAANRDFAAGETITIIYGGLVKKI